MKTTREIIERLKVFMEINLTLGDDLPPDIRIRYQQNMLWHDLNELIAELEAELRVQQAADNLVNAERVSLTTPGVREAQRVAGIPENWKPETTTSDRSGGG